MRRAAEEPFTLEQVGPDVWAAIDNGHAAEPASSNAGFIIGADGVAVVDTFSNENAARRLLAAIRTRTTLPIKFVVNTHYHIDHVAGNGVFREAGAVIVAHENVREWIRSQNITLLGQWLTPDLKAMIDRLERPTMVYEESANLYLGGRRIEVRSLPGHTGGDSVVMFPEASVVFAGDLFWQRMLPNLIDASTGPWIETLNTLLAGKDERAVFVPGHGSVGHAQDVAEFRDYLTAVRQLVQAARDRGESGEALLKTALPTLKSRFGDWEFQDEPARENLLQTEAELNGVKPLPRPPS